MTMDDDNNNKILMTIIWIITDRSPWHRWNVCVITMNGGFMRATFTLSHQHYLCVCVCFGRRDHRKITLSHSLSFSLSADRSLSPCTISTHTHTHTYAKLYSPHMTQTRALVPHCHLLLGMGNSLGISVNQLTKLANSSYSFSGSCAK